MRLGKTLIVRFYLSNRLKLVIISACLFLYCAHLHAQNNKRPRFLRDVGGDNASSGPCSGVIGTASAYYLARAGFEVLVVDRQDGPALETSFANAGQVSPGYASPWAARAFP